MDNRIWNILLVEDDEDDYLLTKSLLSEARGSGFRLIWADTYEAALAALDEAEYDVLLVDYLLGSQNGIEFVRQAAAIGCTAPAIVLTGQGSYEVDLEAMQSGAVDFLLKDQINSSLIERTIRYALERRQAQEALRRAHDELEMRVQERTQELADTNQQLRSEIDERIRAETAVRESEAKFRKLAEATSTAIFIVEDMHIRYANPAARFITGYETDELLKMHFWEIAHPSYRKVLKQHGIAGQWASFHSSDVSAQMPTRYELKLLTKDREERWVDISAGSIDFQEQPAWVVTAFDITERDLAEQALRQANEQLETAKQELEQRVEERTAELSSSNNLLAWANQQLTQTNQLMQTVLETEPDGLAVIAGPDLTFRLVNPTYQTLASESKVSLVGRTFADVWSPDPDHDMVKILKEVIETGKPVFGSRFQRQAPDGTNHHFSTHIARLSWNEQPAVLMVLWETTRVVEAQRRADDAAREIRRQAEELDAVFTATADVLLIYDAEGNPLLANPAAIQLLGIDLAGQKVQQLAQNLWLDASSRERVAPEALPVTRALNGETVKGEPLVFTSPDGALHTFLASAAPLVTRDNRWGAMLMLHDISERESLMAQLAAEQARLKAIIDNAPEGIIVAGRDSEIVLANPAAGFLYARPIPIGQDYLAQATLQLMDTEGNLYEPRELPLTRSALDGETYRNVEALIRWPDGQLRNLLINSGPIYNMQGQLSGAVSIFQDITERKREAEEMLLSLAQIEVQRRLIQHRETERLVIAQELHDDSIQGLIAVNLTLSEAIMMVQHFLEVEAFRVAEGEPMLSKLNVIRVMLEQQIHNLRTFCSELRPPTLAPFGLEKAMRSYIESFQHKHPELKLEASLAADSRRLPEETRLALYRIFQELMNNIVRHSQASQVQIVFSLDESQAELEVTDDGRGFTAPVHWVELARQGHLGLVGVRERAEAVGGEMNIVTLPGKGTHVYVHVPVKLNQVIPRTMG